MFSKNNIITNPNSSRPNFFPEWLTFLLIGTGAGTIFEFRTYFWKILQLNALQPTAWDKLLMYWSLWAKTLVLLFPFVLLMYALSLVAKQTARWLSALGVGCVVVWLVADVKLMQATGCHISHYVVNIFDGLGGYGGDDPLKLGLRPLQHGGAACAILLAIHWVLRRYLTPFVQSHATTVSRGLCGSYLLLSLGIFPAMYTVSQPVAFEWLFGRMATQSVLFVPESVPHFGEAAFGVNVDHDFLEVGQKLLNRTLVARPSDSIADVKLPHRPNVTVLIVESFRSDSIDPQRMPRLYNWAKQGINARQHYANANSSAYGAFALLNGRWPLAYHATLDAKVPQQMGHLLKTKGYRSSLIASCGFDYSRMNEYLGESEFENLDLDDAPERPWHQRDKSTLSKIRHKLKQSSSEPQFVVSYLMSTHFNYSYPSQYAVHQSNMKGEFEIDPRTQTKDDFHNRYLNSLAYMDDLLGNFLDQIDHQKNIVIITGDHAESFWDDGFVTHGSQLSDSQTCVPMVIIGAQSPAQEIHTPSSHVDVIPTLLHVLTNKPVTLPGCDGLSLLDPRHQQQALLIHPTLQGFEMVLVSIDGRLRVHLKSRKAEPRVVGFVDVHGRVQSELKHNIQEFSKWRECWHSELSDKNQLATQPNTKSTLR